MVPKRRNPAKDKSPSPLDEQARALAEQEEKLRAKMESCQKLIAEAPAIAREQARQRREELINRASRTDARPGCRTALPDRRFDVNVAVPAQRRRLRAERRQGRLLFFVLLLVLAGLITWAYYTFTNS